MRSAVVALLSFVALPTIPLSSTLDVLIELARDIVGVAHTSSRQDLMDFGEHIARVVDQLVSALRNEQLSQQTRVRENLEELQRTLENILRDMFYINGSENLIACLRRVLFLQEDHMGIARMRQQLDNALSLFHFATACELLTRPQNLPQSPHHAFSSSTMTSHDRHNGRQHAVLHTSESTQAGLSSPCRNQVGRHDPLPNELKAVSLEVKDLRRSSHRSRRPLLAMELALALGRYSDLLAESGHTTEALSASQESASLFKALAEKGSEIYYDFD
ncbi:hypothetical protein OPQ81_010471 [Rhizoctonia solani]|nr:hypothetical protein OPQ81_010471 [Rhizoctonia solani]